MLCRVSAVGGVCTVFFFKDAATTEIYTLSLHDALPISPPVPPGPDRRRRRHAAPRWPRARSEEHTSELQSLTNLVCRLLLEKKKCANPRKKNPQAVAVAAAPGTAGHASHKSHLYAPHRH